MELPKLMPLYFKWIVEARSLPQTRCGTSKNFQWSLFRKCSKKLWLSFSNKARPTEKELSLLQRPLRALFDCFGCTGQLDLFLSLFADLFSNLKMSTDED